MTVGIGVRALDCRVGFGVRAYVLGLLVCLTLPRAASPQVTLQGRCEELLRRVAAATAARDDLNESARLPECRSAAPRALAQGFERLRTSRDREQLENYLIAMERTAHPDQFGVAMRVAQNPDATLEARVSAMMHLFSLLDPSAMPSYSGFTAGLDENGVSRGQCDGRHRAGGTISGLDSLPGDWEAAIHQMARRIYRDRAIRNELRSAAFCLL